MLQPLPLPPLNISRVAWNLFMCPPARRYFARGGPAGCVYVVETGAAEVAGDGHLITTLGPGRGSGRLRCYGGCRLRPWCARPQTSSCRD